MFAFLSKLKGMRGTVLDPFGYSKERRTERALIGEYIALIEYIVEHVQIHDFAGAISIAETALDISGYGHVKDQAIQTARRKWHDYREKLGNQQLIAPARRKFA